MERQQDRSLSRNLFFRGHKTRHRKQFSNELKEWGQEIDDQEVEIRSPVFHEIESLKT